MTLVERTETMEQIKTNSYRRLFIMRKDLKMSPGKLAAQVAHCAEAYWTRLIQNHSKPISGTDDICVVQRFKAESLLNILAAHTPKPFVKQEIETICLRPKLWLRSWGWLRAEILG